jgi:hypothetical protein
MSEKSETYHVYDPGYGGTLGQFATLDEAIACANESIEHNYRPNSDEEWGDDISNLAVFIAPADEENPEEVGKMVARAREIDVERRPDDVDEEGYSPSSDMYWGSTAPDYYCDYKVLPLVSEPSQS